MSRCEVKLALLSIVVDDEPVNVQALINYLSLANYTVVTAANGHEALEYLASDKPCDLVLLDVMMPRLSGFEVCERIRESYSHADLPVILLTAHGTADRVIPFSHGQRLYEATTAPKKEFFAMQGVDHTLDDGPMHAELLKFLAANAP